MSFTPLNPLDIEAGDILTSSILTQIKSNLDDLNSRLEILEEGGELPDETDFIWDTNITGYTLGANGAAERIGSITNYNTFIKSAQNPLDGDFEMIYEVSSGDLSTASFVGISQTLGVENGNINTFAGFHYDGFGLFAWGAGAQQNAVNLAAGVNNLKIRRIGGTVKLFVNDTQVYENSVYNTGLSYPIMRLNGRITGARKQLFGANYIQWTPRTKYTPEADGGFTSTNVDAGSENMIYDDNIVDGTGSFDVTFNFNTTAWTSQSFFGFSDSAKTQWSGLFSSGSNQGIMLLGNSDQGAVNILSGENSFRIVKTGTTMTYTLNGNIVNTFNSVSVPTQIKFCARTMNTSTYLTSAIKGVLGTPITYDFAVGTGFVLESDGGVSGGAENSENYVKSITHSDADDFEYEWDFDWTNHTLNNTFVGLTSSPDSNGWYNGLTCIETVSIGFARYWNATSPGSGFALAAGPHKYRLKRVGTTLSIYLDDVLVNTITNYIGPWYPTVRTNSQVACTASRKL